MPIPARPRSSTVLHRVDYRFRTYDGPAPEATLQLERDGFCLVEGLLSADELARRIADFRAAVDELLPGRYEWLADESLHCTVRALDGGAG